MAELICIVCPRGCHLKVNESDYSVTGNNCSRGAEYGSTELKNPSRVLTSTVRLSGGTLPRCPVRTSAAIPKPMLFDAMELLKSVTLTAPVKTGQVVVENILGTGADVIVTRNID